SLRCVRAFPTRRSSDLQLFQVIFSILGWIVVAWFSRVREFRADAGGARLVGRQNMISALRELGRLNDPEIAAAEAQRAPSFPSRSEEHTSELQSHLNLV